MIEFYGPRGVNMFRKHVHTYSKGYRGASALRNEVNRVDDPQETRALLDDFFRNNEIIV
jgi:tRNA-dihydrouridine synthase B